MTATDRSVPHLPPPLSACLLSNGRYTVMTRDTGSGFTQWRNRAVTRWREDVTADMLGSYLFLRDRATGAVWSATPQPLGASGEVQPMRLVEGRAEYGVCRESIDATLAVAVPHTFDGDVRRLTIRNERADLSRVQFRASGFERVDIQYSAPVPDHVKMKAMDLPAEVLTSTDPSSKAMVQIAHTMNANAAILNSLLFTYLDYAAIGFRS